MQCNNLFVQEKQIESDVPLNTLNEIGNKTNNKKSKKDTDIEERCKATTSFKVSSNKIKRNLDSDPALESELGFKVKKINSSTVETSQVGCTTSFKVETSREYWRSVNSAIRSELLNYKENILLKGQIKRQKKGMIYSYRNKEVARASRRQLFVPLFNHYFTPIVISILVVNCKFLYQ